MPLTEADIEKLPWKPTDYKSPHEWIKIEHCPKLAEEIMRTGVPDVFEGRVYKYMLRSPYKYWIVWPCINRALLDAK